MESRRLFQTTVLHPLKPEFSISALFVAAALPADIDIDGLTTALGMDPLSGGSISEAELRRVLASIVTGSFDAFDMDDRAFRIYVNEINLDFDYLERAIHEERFVIDKGAPRKEHFAAQTGGPGSETLIRLLDESFGAALGLYTLSDRARHYDLESFHKIELLSLLVPYGILLCGSMDGMSRALHFGLYERIYLSLMDKRLAPRAAG